jgi:MATE family multidrug resistance protein
MTANAISNQFDSIVYTTGMSVAIACLAMVGQCLGSRDLLRIRKTVRVGAFTVTAASLFIGGVFVLLSRQMLGLMTDSQAVIEIAREKMIVLCLTYFITSIMEVFSFSLRALGAHTCTLVVGIVCGFFIRSSWVWFVWPLNKTLGMIYLSYPVSAFVAVLIYAVSYAFVIKKMKISLCSRQKTVVCAE